MRAKRSVLFLSTLHRPWLRLGLTSSLIATAIAVGVAQRTAVPVEARSATREIARSAVVDDVARVNAKEQREGRDVPLPARSPFASKPESKPMANAAPASPEKTRRPDPDTIATAKRELAQLQAQEPTNFLAVFDMMRDEGRFSDELLDTARRASHAYILARMGILERMLRRHIDDPESDATVESDDLSRIDADFQKRMESLARDVPPLENVQALLTTTILKAPAFTESSPASESAETSERP